METKWVEEFFQFLEVEKSASPNTVSAYRADLTQFASTTDAKRRSWREVRLKDARAFIETLQKAGYKDATVARKIAAIKSFFHFLTAEGLVSQNPMEELLTPHVTRILPRSLSPEELGRLFQQSAQQQTPEGQRNKVMVTLLCATGLRVTELVSLDLGDLDLRTEPASVRCLGNGGRDRNLALNTAVTEAMREYITQIRPRLVRKGGEPALFTNHRGERLTRQGLWLILKNYASRAGLDKKVTVHTLRHTYARQMLDGGEPLETVQKALGHASKSTTAHYQELVPA